MSTDYTDLAQRCLDHLYPFGSDLRDEDPDRVMRLAEVYAHLAQAQAVDRLAEELSQRFDDTTGVGQDVADSLDVLAHVLNPGRGRVRRWLADRAQRRRDARAPQAGPYARHVLAYLARRPVGE